MFGSKNNTSNKRNFIMAKNEVNSRPEKLNRIVEGTIIEGEIKSDSNIRIDGHVKGQTYTKGRLVVGPHGIIEGEVMCANADIEGTVNGKISVTELLSLKASSNLSGDIITKKLSIEPGAIFTGNCSMGAKVKELLSNQEKGAMVNAANKNTPLAKAE